MECQNSYLNSGHRRIIFGKIVEEIELLSEIEHQSPKLKIEDERFSEKFSENLESPIFNLGD